FLSGGERRLVMFAAAIAQDSEIILMDEPTTFLDVEKRMRVLSIIHNLRKTGKTLIGVFHEVDILYSHCDSIILLKNGEPITFGNPVEKINKDTLLRTFGVEFIEFESPFGTRFEPDYKKHNISISEGMNSF
ncbi:ferrichrome ABC transporter (ATP-binding p) related protein, partial [mine drainage metagenome]